MQVRVLGGFLGAGKTSAIRAAARVLSARGEQVAIITNDQGYSLVDTELCKAVGDVVEIGGGCFCCRYDDLEAALDAAAAGGATVALAEAVGSCTDLVATVLAPLADRRDDVTVAPLSVLVDPFRAAEIDSFPEPVRYLFRKQIEEADVVVLSRADLDPPDAEPFVRAIRADVPIARISAADDTGIEPWLEQVPSGVAAPLSIDYDTYATAEALLGWANGRAILTGDLVPADVLRGFFAAMADAPVAHLKVRAAGGGGHLVRRGAPPDLQLDSLPDRVDRLELLVNARVATDPDDLRTRLEQAVRAAAPGASVEWTELASFKPGYPVPIHRYETRDALTRQIAAHLNLQAGTWLLDVRCRDGSALRAIEVPVNAVGIDPDATPGPSDGMTLLQGRASRIAMADRSIGAALAQWALSELPEPAAGVAELHRVLQDGARLGVADRLDALPELRHLLVRAGFTVEHEGDAWLVVQK